MSEPLAQRRYRAQPVRLDSLAPGTAFMTPTSSDEPDMASLYGRLLYVTEGSVCVALEPRAGTIRTHSDYEVSFEREVTTRWARSAMVCPQRLEEDAT